MFKISNLTATVNNKSILNDLSITINDGETHVIMGKNGIGKSSLCKIIMNDSNYNILNGSIIYNNENLLKLNTSEISQKGIMLISQNPTSIEGVTNAELLRSALRERKIEKINIYDFNKSMEDICDKLSLDKSFIHKEVNVGASGGERKKVELLHMGILKPSLIILDELDSGLDVDALKACTKFIIDYQKESKCSILIITHHAQILDYLHPTYVHILSGGKIVKTGDIKLAKQIEQEGYKAFSLNEDDKDE